MSAPHGRAGRRRAALASVSLVLLLVHALAGPSFAASTPEIYSPQHRTAEELLPLATALLGDRGRALVDAGKLVLIAPLDVLEEARAVLALRDVARAVVVVDVESRSLRSLRGTGRAVRWRGSTGSLRSGMLVDSPAGSPEGTRGVRTIMTAKDEGSRFSVRVLDGEAAHLEIGKLEVFRDRSWFERYTTFLEVESGLTVTPHALGNGAVQLLLEWSDSGTEPAARVGYARMSTTLRVEPGETVVLGSVVRRGADTPLKRLSARSSPSQESLLLLLHASVE